MDKFRLHTMESDEVTALIVDPEGEAQSVTMTRIPLRDEFPIEQVEETE